MVRIVPRHRGGLPVQIIPFICHNDQSGASVVFAGGAPDHPVGFHLAQGARGGGAVNADKSGNVGRVGQAFVQHRQQDAPCDPGQANGFQLLVQPAPLLRQDMNTPQAMRDVWYALTPVTLAGIWFFGAGALLVLLASIAGAVLTECAAKSSSI